MPFDCVLPPTIIATEGMVAMSKEDDLDIGSIAVAHGLITAEALKECRDDLRLMAERGLKLSLPDIFLSKSLLGRDKIVSLQKLKSALSGEKAKLGPFELLAKLGEGGMGAVYRVRDTRSGQLAALKILPVNLAHDPEYIERFEREARILTSISHPNIVRAVDTGHLDYMRTKLPYMAMEIEKETLRDRIEREGAIAEGRALEWMTDVARALQHAHSRELVHRDVKPDNVFITEDGHAKLGDFGLVRDVAETATRITQTGMFMGSVHYASPEQAQSVKDIDIRSDIYSLGAAFYHAFTGQAPFEGDSAPAILVMHLSEELPWPGDVNPRVSDGASELIAKMMAKKREERFQNPIELLRALDELRSRGDVRPFLRSSALSSIARSRDKRQRVLDLTRKRKERVRRRVERRPRVHPYVYAAGAAAGVLVLVILLAVILGGGK